MRFCLLYLVYLVEPDEPGRPDKPDRSVRQSRSAILRGPVTMNPFDVSQREGHSQEASQSGTIRSVGIGARFLAVALFEGQRAINQRHRISHMTDIAIRVPTLSRSYHVCSWPVFHFLHPEPVDFDQ